MQIFTASNILFKIVDSSHSSMRRLTVSMDEFRNLKSLHVLDLNYSRLSCICSLTGCKELSRLQELATSLGEEDTVDIISNFIADKDPMLQVATTINYQPSHSAEIAVHFQSTFKSSLKYQYFIF